MPSALPRRILVVDDEPSVRDSIRQVLRHCGHSVEIAASGTEALALLQESRFDLVITDYEMPGMKGDTLALAIKAAFPMLPVLMITAYGEQLRASANPLLAVDAILGKPFGLDELRQAVATLCATTASMPEPQLTTDDGRRRAEDGPLADRRW